MVMPKLVIEIVGDAKKLGESLKTAGGEAEGFAAKFGGIAKVAGVGLLAVGAGAVALAADSVKTFEHAAGNVKTLQRLTGDTAENMSRLAFAAQETGVSQDTLEGSMKKLSKAVEGHSKAFDQYGIATTDAQGKTLGMNDIIQNAAEVFAKMPDGIEKNALAMKLFGKSGTDMIPLLDQGKTGLEKFGEEADKFGITIGQKGVDAYKKNVQNSREMHAAMEGLKIQIGEKLMPVITTITTWLAEHLPAAMAFVKRAIDDVVPVIKVMADAVAWLVQWFVDHWDQITTVVQTAVTIITDVVDAFVTAAEAIWATFGDAIMTAIQGTWDFISGIFTAAFDIIVGLFDFFRDLFTGDWGKLWGDIQTIVQGVWDAIGVLIQAAIDGITVVLQVAWDTIKLVAGIAWEAIKTAVTTPIDALTGLLQTVWDGITGAAQTAWAALKGAAIDVWQAISDVIMVPVNWVKDTVKGVWDTMKSDAETVWDTMKAVVSAPINAIKGFIQGLIDKIDLIVSKAQDAYNALASLNPFSSGPATPKGSTSGPAPKPNPSQTPARPPGFAVGTSDSPEGIAWVGEQGPELMFLPQHSTILSNTMSRQLTGGGGDTHYHVHMPDGYSDPIAYIKTNTQAVKRGWRP